MDNIAAAFRIVAEDDAYAEASVSLNSQTLYPTNCLDLELLKLVAQHPPIREQLEAVRDMLVEALAGDNVSAEDTA